VVEPIRLTTPEKPEEILRNAHLNPSQIPAEDVCWYAGMAQSATEAPCMVSYPSFCTLVTVLVVRSNGTLSSERQLSWNRNKKDLAMTQIPYAVER
jgi:hypothetical protein